MAQIGMTETLSRAAKPVLNFELWSFEFVSSFDIRISDLLPLPPQARMILPFIVPPEVLAVINRLAYRVKSG